MESLIEKKEGQRSPDFTLLLSRIEGEIVKGHNLSGFVKVLSRKDVWTRLPEDLQLKWAKLAQMAGAPDTTLEVLAYINQAHPEQVDAWTERLDLLMILDRREELARVLAQARDLIGEE